MKKLFAVLATFVISVSVHAAQFKAGQNYKIINNEASKNPTVTEFFSFYCPHCAQFEPIIQKLKAQLPKNAQFEKSHVSFMGGKMGMSMSKAYATMVVLKVEDKMTPIMFDIVQNMRKPPKTDQELRQIFIDAGVEAKKFDAAFNGFAVDSMVRRFDKKFEQSGLTGVPGVVVNDRYLVETQGLKTLDEYYALVNYLLTLK